MISVDSHVHSKNSSDGHDSIASIAAEAEAKGLYYVAVTDHLDMDLKCGGNKTPIPWKFIDLDKYYAEWKATADSLALRGSQMKFNFGIEAGFATAANSVYAELLPKYPFDVVINSVHFVGGWDVYFPNAFFRKPKEKMYSDYLDTVLESLNAPYDYDIVAHIGYVTRNAPYRDKSMRYADFAQKFDAILKGVIARDKALEVNTHTNLFPTEEILRKYYELGGRKISFGSDSHRGELCKDYQKTCVLLKNIGFTHFSVFTRHREELVPIG